MSNKQKSNELPFEIANKSSEGYLNWHGANDWAYRAGDGWRLPTVDELQQIYNSGGQDLQERWYWSSESRANNNKAICVNMSTGTTLDNVKDYYHCSVRFVRDKQLNITEELVNINARIDALEKLIQQTTRQVPDSVHVAELPFEIAPELLEKDHVDWNEAVEYCTLLGNGWRLPSREELQMIYKSDNDLNGNCNYWSSAACNDRSRAWYQNMHKGDQFTTNKDFSTNDYRVRPVRDIVKSKLPFVVAAKAFEINTDWDSAVRYCENLGDGWRLPTKDELTLIYKSENDFDKVYYWSSSEKDPFFVASVSMNSGWVEWEDDKSQNNIRVRAVRDITPNLPFEIADKSTEFQANWFQASKHCDSLGFGWRLPTSRELKMIFDTFNDCKKEYYWTSTEYFGDSDAGYFDMKTSNTGRADKSTSVINVRAVKSKVINVRAVKSKNSS